MKLDLTCALKTRFWYRQPVIFIEEFTLPPRVRYRVISFPVCTLPQNDEINRGSVTVSYITDPEKRLVRCLYFVSRSGERKTSNLFPCREQCACCVTEFGIFICFWNILTFLVTWPPANRGLSRDELKSVCVGD